MPRTPVDHVRRGFDALERHAWAAAYLEFAAGDGDRSLGGVALEGLARAAFWTGRAQECLSAWERAYAAHLAAGEERRAAAAALELARRHSQRASPAQAQGWRATAARLLANHPDAPECGRLLNLEANGLILAGRLDDARQRTVRAYDIGARAGARDVQAIALNLQGQALVRSGRVEEGLRLVDESCAQAAAGLLEPYETGLLYCTTIGLCRDLADYERARELTEATAQWCELNEITSSFPGICRIHRAELFRLHGDLARAEVEAQAALDELLPRTLFWAARAFNEIGIVKLRKGLLDEAEAAFARAQELGLEPDAGRALVLIARGKSETARVRLTRALEGRPSDLLDRATMLSALWEAALASGAAGVAAEAAAELETIAATVARPAFRAAASAARGALLVARGDAAAALAPLREALQFWLGLDAPYEAARTRVLIARAHAALADEPAARFELEVAARAFAAMEARREQATVEALLRGSGAPDPLRPLTRRQREVARLVAEGRSNREIAMALFVSERTAEYHVQQILNRLGVDSRAQIAAWYARNT